MTTKPMVALSVWGGANDGARFLVAHRSVMERHELRFLGECYTVRHDERTGWKAVYAKRRDSDR
jgi:hypothetical protein